MTVDDGVLVDPDRLIALGGPVLAATASAGAQLRAGMVDVDSEALAGIAAGGRPRSVVVMGAGGSSAAGEVLGVCAGRGSSVPVVTISGPGLPGWVGPLDLVMAVSASGGSPETLAVVAEAGRRGCEVVGVAGGGGDDSLQSVVAQARGHYLSAGRLPHPRRARSLTWQLAAPLLLVGQALGFVDGGPEVLANAADELDAASLKYGPGVPLGANLAKDLALIAAEGYPMLWGTPGAPAVAARRASRQLAENAGISSSSGAFPEVARTHARVLANAAEVGDEGAEDIFRDRVNDPAAHRKPHLIVFTDDECDELSMELVEASEAVAVSAGLAVTRVDGSGGHPLARLARLVQPWDLASVYAAVVLGFDPGGSAGDLHPALGSRK